MMRWSPVCTVLVFAGSALAVEAERQSAKSRHAKTRLQQFARIVCDGLE
jgi:hypothetical protein